MAGVAEVVVEEGAAAEGEAAVVEAATATSADEDTQRVSKSRSGSAHGDC